MVLNLDKCIGCHTCSVTCKNVWTNRPGMEYVWFNNVETKPGIGYPDRWEDQNRWRGGWELFHGKLQLKRGPKLEVLANIFSNGRLPSIDDYYEPFTFDYQNLQTAPRTRMAPTARPVSYITGKKMEKIEGSAAWQDNLGGVDVRTVQDVDLAGLETQREILSRYEETFMFYLPRLCEHCLNPACAASCPSGSIYKRAEDGIVVVDQDKCKGWRMCVSGCPYKKIYYNWASGKAEKCIFCYPRIESGMPTVCSETCTGRIRYVGVVLYDADKIKDAASAYDDESLYEAQRDLFLDPNDPEVQAAALAAGITQDWIEAAKRSPIYKMIVEWGIALPLHPEFRTLPMVWYVPPLSPIAEAVDAGKISGEGFLPKVDELRIPLQYLANLLTGGDIEPVYLALARLLALRTIVRAYADEAGLDQFLASELPRDVIAGLPGAGELKKLGLSVDDLCGMHKLLAIANHEDRFVVPTGDRNGTASLYAQGMEGLSTGGGDDMRYRARHIFGGTMDREIAPTLRDYERIARVEVPEGKGRA